MSINKLLSLPVLTVLGILGLVLFILFYDQVSPTASIDMRVSRQHVQNLAENYLKDRGFNIQRLQKSIVFDSDELAAVYLQKTQGAALANQLMRSEIPIWHWRVRYFKPLEKEEYRVLVSPQGQLLGFDRLLEEEKEGKNLEQNQAEEIALGFLKDKVLVDLSSYERVEASSDKKKARTDHHFVWKKKGFKVAEGENRLSVEVQGDSVSSFRFFFKVPEQFQRDFQKESSSGFLLSSVSQILAIVLFVASFVIFVLKFRQNDIRWKFTLPIVATLLVLFVGTNLNDIPLINAAYLTQIGYETFLGITLTGVLIGGIFYGIIIFLTGASGDALTREIYPKSVAALSELISGKILTKRYVFSALNGYLIAFIVLGIYIAFYSLGGKYFGIWVPLDSPYSNMLSTAIPALYPLLVGFTASFSEEFVFRFFAIPLLKKYLKLTFLALFIPALVWALGHTTYVVFPVYVRAVEVTLIGLVFGWAFIRYGILTCIIAHFVADAIFVGMPLLKATNQYFLISGLIIVGLALMPAIPAVLRLKKG